MSRFLSNLFPALEQGTGWVRPKNNLNHKNPNNGNTNSLSDREARQTKLVALRQERESKEKELDQSKREPMGNISLKGLRKREAKQIKLRKEIKQLTRQITEIERMNNNGKFGKWGPAPSNLFQSHLTPERRLQRGQMEQRLDPLHQPGYSTLPSAITLPQAVKEPMGLPERRESLQPRRECREPVVEIPRQPHNNPSATPKSLPIQHHTSRTSTHRLPPNPCPSRTAPAPPPKPPSLQTLPRAVPAPSYPAPSLAPMAPRKLPPRSNPASRGTPMLNRLAPLDLHRQIPCRRDGRVHHMDILFRRSSRRLGLRSAKNL